METLLEILEREREKLFQSAASLRELLGSLAETLRTLSGPLRRSFTSAEAIASALKPEADRLSFGRPELQSLDGEVQSNTSRLIGLINNLYVIRNRHLRAPHFIEFTDLAEIEQVQAEIRNFLEELYAKSLPLLEARSETAALARQKRKDVEELLDSHMAPWFARLRQIKTDEYLARLRPQLKEAVGGVQDYKKDPQAYEPLIKEKCARIGLPFDPPTLQLLMNELGSSDEQFERKILQHYAGGSDQAQPSDQVLRRGYLRILARYLASLHELEHLAPILQSIYYLYQPKPSLLERLAAFLAMLVGRERRIPKKDIQFSYIASRETFQRRTGSLETLMDRVNELEKTMLKLKSRLRQTSIRRMEDAVERLHPALEAISEDCAGLVQWLGKPGNRERLSRIPDSSQRTFHQALTSMQATLIINQERLAELARKGSSRLKRP